MAREEGGSARNETPRHDVPAGCGAASSGPPCAVCVEGLVGEGARSEHKPRLLPLQPKERLGRGKRAVVPYGGDSTPSLRAGFAALM